MLHRKGKWDPSTSTNNNCPTSREFGKAISLEHRIVPIPPAICITVRTRTGFEKYRRSRSHSFWSTKIHQVPHSLPGYKTLMIVDATTSVGKQGLVNGPVQSVRLMGPSSTMCFGENQRVLGGRTYGVRTPPVDIRLLLKGRSL